MRALAVVAALLALVACSENDGASKTSAPASSVGVGGEGTGASGGGGDSGAGAMGGEPNGSGGNGAGGMPPFATRETVLLFTLDGKTLTAELTTSSLSPSGSPGVVLIHQYQRDLQQWGDFAAVLALRGYRTLAFDLRGHGQSDPYDGPLMNLLDDPDGAPRDVDAAIAWLGTMGAADPTRIGLIGTSIGANLTVAAAVKGQAKTYVSLSARIPPTQSLAKAPVTGMQSVFYFAGELDPGNQANDAGTMFDITADPRDVRIFLNSADHGIALLDNQAGIRDLIFDWLSQTI